MDEPRHRKIRENVARKYAPRAVQETGIEEKRRRIALLKKQLREEEEAERLLQRQEQEYEEEEEEEEFEEEEEEQEEEEEEGDQQSTVRHDNINYGTARAATHRKASPPAPPVESSEDEKPPQRPATRLDLLRSRMAQKYPKPPSPKPIPRAAPRTQSFSKELRRRKCESLDNHNGRQEQNISQRVGGYQAHGFSPEALRVVQQLGLGDELGLGGMGLGGGQRGPQRGFGNFPLRQPAASGGAALPHNIDPAVFQNLSSQSNLYDREQDMFTNFRQKYGKYFVAFIVVGFIMLRRVVRSLWEDTPTGYSTEATDGLISGG